MVWVHHYWLACKTYRASSLGDIRSWQLWDMEDEALDVALGRFV